MREIVEHRYPGCFAAHFHASFHACERREPALDLVAGEPQFGGANGDSGGIALVVFAGQGDVEAAEVGDAEKTDTTLRAHDDLAHVGVLAVCDDKPAVGHYGHKLAECALHRGQIRKDVGVVKLDVVEDYRTGR